MPKQTNNKYLVRCIFWYFGGPAEASFCILLDLDEEQSANVSDRINFYFLLFVYLVLH